MDSCSGGVRTGSQLNMPSPVVSTLQSKIIKYDLQQHIRYWSRMRCLHCLQLIQNISRLFKLSYNIIVILLTYCHLVVWNLLLVKTVCCHLLLMGICNTCVLVHVLVSLNYILAAMLAVMFGCYICLLWCYSFFAVWITIWR